MPGNNIIRALSSEGVFSYGSLHKLIAALRSENSPRPQRQISSRAFYCVTYQCESGDGSAFSCRKDQHQRLAVFLKQNMAILSKIFKCDSKIFQCVFLVLEAAFFPFSLQTETFPWS